MTREQLLEEIRNAAKDNQMSCERAQELAKKLKVPPKEIGALANELGIKLTGCRLGCF